MQIGSVDDIDHGYVTLHKSSTLSVPELVSMLRKMADGLSHGPHSNSEVIECSFNKGDDEIDFWVMCGRVNGG